MAYPRLFYFKTFFWDLLVKLMLERAGTIYPAHWLPHHQNGPGCGDWKICIYPALCPAPPGTRSGNGDRGCARPPLSARPRDGPWAEAAQGPTERRQAAVAEARLCNTAVHLLSAMLLLGVPKRPQSTLSGRVCLEKEAGQPPASP